MKNSGSITTLGAAFLGIGSMVGAGIFALLGEAGSVSGSATYLSFILGGIVALSSGYSYAKLGARFPSEGGVIEYLFQAYGRSIFSGGFSIIYLIATIITMAMVAQTFGSYLASMTPGVKVPYLKHIYVTLVILVFTLINAIGSNMVTRAESIIVVLKITILCVFIFAGMIYVNWDNFTPSSYPPASSLLGSIAITYFAYTGFAVITNSASDFKNPVKQMPRAIYIAIGTTVVLYLGLNFVVFGNLSLSQILQYQDTALAYAAKPIFGATGFTIMAVAALLATASSLNANLFSSFRIVNQEAKDGELSPYFSQRRWLKGSNGLYLICFILIILSNLLDLNTVAQLGSIATLTFTTSVHLGHLRLLDKTKANKSLIVLAVVLNVVVILFFFSYQIESGSYDQLVYFLVLIILALGAEKWYLNRNQKT